MKDRIVIVTGAFGALGRVVAETLEAKGARVVRVDATTAVPQFLLDRPDGGLAMPGIDLTDYVATQAMAAQVVAREGAIDALVNIAGGFRWETVEAGDPATWDLMHALNVNAILPGIIDTPANRADMPAADTVRWVTPQALADVVAFLLSDAARAITGAGIPVTGRL